MYIQPSTCRFLSVHDDWKTCHQLLDFSVKNMQTFTHLSKLSFTTTSFLILLPFAAERILTVIAVNHHYLQCFDAVGWASGRGFSP